MNILVRSKDRNRTHGSGNPADFVLSFPEAVYGTYQLVWATIPNTIYNVRSGNNKLYLRNQNGSETTVTVEPKNYTGTTLASALTALLSGVTVEYDAATLKFKFKLAAVDTHFQFFTSKSGSIHSVLGFESSSVPNEVYQIVFKGAGPTDSGTYAPNAVSLGGINSIGVRIKEASGIGWSVSAGDGSRSHGTTLLIPLLSSAGEFQSSAQDLHKQKARFNERTRSMTVQLVDPDTMEVLDMNGANWEMLLSKTA